VNAFAPYLLPARLHRGRPHCFFSQVLLRMLTLFSTQKSVCGIPPIPFQYTTLEFRVFSGIPNSTTSVWQRAQQEQAICAWHAWGFTNAATKPWITGQLMVWRLKQKTGRGTPTKPKLSPKSGGPNRSYHPSQGATRYPKRPHWQRF